MAHFFWLQDFWGRQGTYCYRRGTCDCKQGIFVRWHIFFIDWMELFVGSKAFLYSHKGFFKTDRHIWGWRGICECKQIFLWLNEALSCARRYFCAYTGILLYRLAFLRADETFLYLGDFLLFWLSFLVEIGIFSGNRIFGIKQGIYCSRKGTCDCKQGSFVCWHTFFIGWMEVFVESKAFLCSDKVFMKSERHIWGWRGNFKVEKTLCWNEAHLCAKRHFCAQPTYLWSFWIIKRHLCAQTRDLMEFLVGNNAFLSSDIFECG